MFCHYPLQQPRRVHSMHCPFQQTSRAHFMHLLTSTTRQIFSTHYPHFSSQAELTPCITHCHDSKSSSIFHSTIHYPKSQYCARWPHFSPFHHSSHSTHYPLPRFFFRTSHTVHSKDPQFSLHTLFSYSIHDPHTPHTVHNPAFNHLTATYSSIPRIAQ
ncbi:hypothetical protein AVEN_6357-1 [Araneus ventricosus]|uniref:Uncharacterized protein n=1 Tax=Araneus ventricosus TaxID=182803 RepID=A0A4Y2HUH0_ARAVE|nr:hypothetical protein AVEN_6357-1 [Araneus ventricosus]